MTESRLIVFTGDKGGVGKSRLAVLMTEWLLSKGKQVQLVDTDPNQTSKIWTQECEALGCRASTPDAPVTIVDTAGTSGTSLNRYIL
jgi:CO dehydrogenase nickel-insertion accessory protein CooC1